MLKFIIACVAIVVWPLAIVATWQYFGQSSVESQSHWSLVDLIAMWAVALGTGSYIKRDL